MSIMSDAPLLALPGGSILQFLLMTLPLFGVYLYFLHLAIQRPNIANPNDDRYGEDRIRLMDILYTFLVTLVAFCCLEVYLLWFVRRRRALSKKYEKEAITVLGNVEYNEQYVKSKILGPIAQMLRWNDYGTCVYDLERVGSHPACDYEDRTRKQLTGTIRKKVRVYHRYPREQVSILVLPKYPYSGQPKIDLEADWASFSGGVGLPVDDDQIEVIQDGFFQAPQVMSRNRSLGVLLVSTAWILFTFFASLFVVQQIDRIDSFYQDENARLAWIIFWSVIGGVVPVVAFGGNFLRWKMYQRWVLHAGKKSKNTCARDDEEGGGYVQMS
mmetsp:Transcript_32001/g.76443  ORF Transcript_32001/g.76443 Transcript_32001/m.76443 type:complete len:328 (+) Transcript_32001:213-1196(+)